MRGRLRIEKMRGKGKRRGTSLVNDVQGAVDDVVKLEGIIGLGEALDVERVVLVSDHRDAHDHLLSPRSCNRASRPKVLKALYWAWA